MRRAMPTWPQWPLKNSQSVNPAARAITFTTPPTPAGRMAESAPMAAGVMATKAPWASASVLVRMTVMRPLPSSQRWTSPPGQRGRLGTPQPGVGEYCHERRVELPPRLQPSLPSRRRGSTVGAGRRGPPRTGAGVSWDDVPICQLSPSGSLPSYRDRPGYSHRSSITRVSLVISKRRM